jgi:hypothetical protein
MRSSVRSRLAPPIGERTREVLRTDSREGGGSREGFEGLSDTNQFRKARSALRGIDEGEQVTVIRPLSSVIRL